MTAMIPPSAICSQVGGLERAIRTIEPERRDGADDQPRIILGVVSRQIGRRRATVSNSPESNTISALRSERGERLALHAGMIDFEYSRFSC